MARIGDSEIRLEDDSLLRGHTKFTGDISIGDELFLAFVRSTVASGRILSIDFAEAEKIPGVIAVFTGSDLASDGVGCFLPRLIHKSPDGSPMAIPAFPPLVIDSVKFIGDPIAMVIAENQYDAQSAVDMVFVEIDVTSSVVDVETSSMKGSPVVWPEFETNHCFRFKQGDAKKTDQAIKAAKYIVKDEFKISRVTAAAIEPRNVIASYDQTNTTYRLDLGTQTPHRIVPDISHVLDIPASCLHVVAHPCGGSFGMKNVGYPEYVCALWAAKKLGRRIRWQASRLESFMADTQARDQRAQGTLALDETGQFLGLKVKIKAALGAYIGPMTTHPPVANLGGLAGVYQTPAISVTVDGFFTNTQSIAPYRGAGRPEATYIIEHMIDVAAQVTGFDKVELRRLNMIKADQLPFETGLNFTYDCGDFPKVFEKALNAADYFAFEKRRMESKKKQKIRGLGVSNPIEIAAGPDHSPNPEFAAVTAKKDGTLEVLVGSQDSGQGHATSFRQLLSDRVGVDPENIFIVTGDTRRIKQGTGTFGSRTIAAAGTSILNAVNEMIIRLAPIAAEKLGVDEYQLQFSQGLWTCAGSNLRNHNIAFHEVQKMLEEDVKVESFCRTNGATFPNACHICEVEIDPETGETEIDRYVIVEDAGRVINPMIMKGQVMGGVVQGIGQALMEQILHDGESGQLLTASFMDYAIPRAKDAPETEIKSYSVPTQNNPLGAKGIGEAGTVGALSATMNAVCDGLFYAKAMPIDMPATARNIWQALQHNGCNFRSELLTPSSNTVKV